MKAAPLRRIQGLVLAAVIVISGCTIGARVDGVAPAVSPRGTLATVTVATGSPNSVEGELIAVLEDALIVRADPGLTRIPFSKIQIARFEDAPGVGRWVREGNDRQRTRLTAFSRYPFGLTAGQLQRLLDAMGQDDLLEIQP